MPDSSHCEKFSLCEQSESPQEELFIPITPCLSHVTACK